MTRKILSIIEPAMLAAMLLAFWYPTPIRDRWLWLLIFIPVVLGLRWLVYGRLWTRTPLDTLLLAFLGLCLLNVMVAGGIEPPYRRSADVAYSFFVLVCRPLLGIALVVYFAEHARLHRSMDDLLIATLILSGIIAVLGLGASQWTSKSDQLFLLVNVLPNIRDSLAPFEAKGGFNVNEIAGALAWICPLLAGLTVYRWGRSDRTLRWTATVIFGAVLLALFLGQSRFALAGVLMGLALVVLLLLPKSQRRIAWGLIGIFVLLELMIFLNVFRAQVTIIDRDEDSFVTRLYLWRSVTYILHDHPFTGVGLNMFRDGRVRELYPVPEYRNPVLPHAHQEWLQVGADAGFPGLILYLAIQSVLVVMLYRAFRKGDAKAKVVAAGVGAGLLAHAFFGLGDAITLWDRFAFLGWWLIALGAAQYALVQSGDLAASKSINLEPESLKRKL